MQQVLQFDGLQDPVTLVQVCVALQVSPDVEQFVQAFPPPPHAVLLSPPTHIAGPAADAWQQPFGQVIALQPPGGVTFWQAWAWLQLVKPSAGQFSQAWPAVPHAVVAVPSSQTPFVSQQPELQVVGPHVSGALHRWSVESQVVGAAQATQAVPSLPHATFDPPATH